MLVSFPQPVSVGVISTACQCWCHFHSLSVLVSFPQPVSTRHMDLQPYSVCSALCVTSYRLSGLLVWHLPIQQEVSGLNLAFLDQVIQVTWLATLPGAMCFRVSDKTGWSGVSILWLGEIASFICHFYLSMAASTLDYLDLFLRYTSHVAGLLSYQLTNQPTNQPTNKLSGANLKGPTTYTVSTLPVFKPAAIK